MRQQLLPQIVRLTPSSYADSLWCRRLFYLGALLKLPASDTGVSPDQGLLVHDVLQQVHLSGSCHDTAHVDAVLRACHADTEQMRGYVTRHERRCPQQFDNQEHEIDRVRFHREPAPMFLASARIDAIWIHDGILDARDYKTGRRPEHTLADDPRARMQAWVLGDDAQRNGLQLRLRYEYLQPEADEDPDPWEPDSDDLAAVGEELRGAVASMWEEESGDAESGRTSWRGINDPLVCRTCRYRSICRDSASPGEPAWPVLSADVES